MYANSECKRNGCTNPGETRARYEGYCSLHCRDMDDCYIEGHIAGLQEACGLARGSVLPMSSVDANLAIDCVLKAIHNRIAELEEGPAKGHANEESQE